jgi:hypothetical protein
MRAPAHMTQVDTNVASLNICIEVIVPFIELFQFFDLLVVFAVPWSLVLFSNVFILFAICKADKMRQSLVLVCARIVCAYKHSAIPLYHHIGQGKSHTWHTRIAASKRPTSV